MISIYKLAFNFKKASLDVVGHPLCPRYSFTVRCNKQACLKGCGKHETCESFRLSHGYGRGKPVQA